MAGRTFCSLFSSSGPPWGVQACVAHGPWHWLLWAKPHSVGDMSITQEEGNSSHKDCAGPARPDPLCHPLLAAGLQRLRGAPGESPRLAAACKHMDRHTCTQKRKDPDTQRRKDMDVLKIAQNPLNLQTSEMLKAPC